MNLVMIGSFKTVEAAEAAHALILHCRKVIDDGTIEIQRAWDTPLKQRFTREQLDFLQEIDLFYLTQMEFEEFGDDVSVELKDGKLVLRTDELDVAAYMKVILKFDGRVEVFSAHDYPEWADG